MAELLPFNPPECPVCAAAPPAVGVFSRAINALTLDLIKAGIRVAHFAETLPERVVGRFRYPDDADDPTPLAIDINSPSACEALLTLAHEAGHLAAWRSVDGYAGLGEEEHERLALAYGFPVIARYAPWVTESIWRGWHEEVRRG